jgi:O-antigen/teichoic acid export membrane protein
MAVLGLCIPPMYLNIMLSQVLISMNRQAAWTWVMAGTTVINPLFNLALIPLTQNVWHNGAIGASISLLLTELVCIGAGYVMIGRVIFNRSSARRVVVGTAIGVAMWGAGYAVEQVAGGFAAIVVAAVTFPVLAALLRLFSPEELTLIRSGLDKFARKLPLPRRRPSVALETQPPG